MNLRNHVRRNEIILAALLILALIVVGIAYAQQASATGGNHPKPPKPSPSCGWYDDDCEPPPPPPVECPEGTVENEYGECVPVEPEPCAEGEIRDASGDCAPVVPPPVVPPVDQPVIDGQAIPRDPPMPAIDQGSKRGPVTTYTCGTARTVHADGSVTYRPLGVPEATCEETGL